MSHHIYQTEGFVLESLNVGEADKMISLFTRDLGLVKGKAQGIRHLKSKLRYFLQDFSYSNVSLVRGREVWRVVNAAELGDIGVRDIPVEVLRAYLRALSLVKRLVQGEEKNEVLFEYIKSARDFLRSLSVHEADAFESIMVLRILYILGYLAPKENLKIFTIDMRWDREILAHFILVKKEALTEINRSLRESHL